MLPNSLLQDRRLSYTARGLLADLLSRPDGWREDGRHMADTSPQGRGAIRKALKELTEAGYYRVEKIRLPDGTIRTETHVHDTPQPVVPGVTRPVSGGPSTGRTGAPLLKNRYQEPSHPAARPEGREESRTDGQKTPAVPDGRVREAVATLFRVLSAEPRLRLGEAEAVELAPLVVQWLERGSTAGELARALLPGLPVPLHSPVGVLRSRLQRKLPPVRVPQQPMKPRYAECAKCHDPVSGPGICAACAGLGGRRAQADDGAVVATNGAARVREAMLAARSVLSAGQLAVAGAG